MRKNSPNTMIKAAARAQLLGKYPIVIFAYLISDFILSAVTRISRVSLDTSRTLSIVVYLLFQAIILLLSGIFLTGQNYLYLNIARKRPYAPRDIWYGFSHYADKILLIELIIGFHILLRSLPFMLLLALWVYTKNIIAAVFAAGSFLISVFYALLMLISYSQSLFLILEDPHATIEELLEASAILMQGNQLAYLRLILSFAGLYILSLLSFGLGFLWVAPYFHASRTNFYLALLKQRAAEKKQAA